MNAATIAAIATAAASIVGAVFAYLKSRNAQAAAADAKAHVLMHVNSPHPPAPPAPPGGIRP